jgi:hypothetical protein
MQLTHTQDNYGVLKQREIIDILIGDTIIEKTENYNIQMPYLSGPKLCEIYKQLGCDMDYSWGGGTCSRWVYMDNLLII